MLQAAARRPALALVLAVALAPAAAVTPVQKVIELMEGMLHKGKAEKQNEQVQFSAYRQFCDDASVEKQRAIEAATEQIVQLEAAVQKNHADAERLTQEIAAHHDDEATWTGDIKAAQKVRTLEKADYDATHEDTNAAIDAIQRAIDVLKEQAYDRPQAEEALLQVSSLKNLKLLPDEARRTIDAFLEEGSDSGFAAPVAYGYEFQSQGVIDMLSKLLEKFVAQRTTLENEEENKHHAYEMLIQDLEAQISEATQDSSDKTQLKAKKLEAKATAESDLTQTREMKDADQSYLNDLTATCEKKAADFESRQALRTEELEAITKAIEIVRSEAVSGTAARHRSLAQRGTSLAALRAEAQGQGQLQAVRFLQGRATQLQSRVLMAAANHMADGPFGKVKKMLQDLLVRLMEEANGEAEHKGWCDTELATNEQTRKEKTDAVEVLHADIDALEGSIAQLAEELGDLATGVAALDAATAKATALREREKAANTETIQDAQDAQTAVAQAITLLKNFYEKAGAATALLQRDPPNAPAIFDSPYKGMADENGGVVGMLEVIESDFARLEAETKSGEVAAQREYDAFISDSAIDKAAKNADIEHKTAKKQDDQQALTVKRSDLEGTQKELDAALLYFDKLKPSCVDSGVSYEDRVQRRKREIESLQEALRILNGEDLA